MKKRTRTQTTKAIKNGQVLTPDPQQEARQDQPVEFRSDYAPDFYPGRKEGPGRAVVLTAAGVQLGYLWTNDDDGLGFVAVSEAGIQRTPEFATAASKAKAAGTPAAEVFDYYAGLASQGLSAGEVTTTDALDTLPE